MRIAIAGLLAGLVLAASASAQDAGVDVASFNGDCSLRVAGKTEACKGVIYTYVRSTDRTSFSAVVGDQVTTFAGGKDEQPKPTEYHLELDRLYTGAHQDVVQDDATGRCDLTLSADGEVIHSLTCQATVKGEVVELRFAGNRIR